MGTAEREHPTRAELRDFAQGRGNAVARARVEKHLATCGACAALLSSVPDDTLMGRLRDAATAGPASPGPGHDDSGHTSPEEVPPQLASHPRYRLTRLLGAGGMGWVYHAVHRVMEREVALKVLAPGLVRSPAAVQRFHQEVKAAARLSHPNIVAAHDADQAGDLHFLVMEYVDGVSLDRLVRKNGRLAPAMACSLARQAALALQHAHEAGLVHRDIKPQNLMVTRKGQVKVLDFGLARLAEEAGRAQAPPGRLLTTIGTVLGTPDYMAPEQVGDSHSVDIRADIYSLGCTLYFLLAGRPPFPDGSPIDKANSHLQTPPEPLESLRPDLPAGLARVVERMMAKRPAERYAAPGEAASALAPFAKSPAADPPPLPESPAPPAAPPSALVAWKWMAAAAGVAVLGILLGVVFSLMSQGPAGSPPPRPGDGRPRPRILLMIPYPRFNAQEYDEVRHALAGEADVTLASTQAGAAARSDAKGKARPMLTATDQRARGFDAVVFVGPPEGVDPFADDDGGREKARRLIADYLAARKPVAALGGGVAVLAAAGVLDGKQAACPPRLRRALPARVEAVDDPTLWDGDLLTAAGPEASQLARLLLARLR
jgi:putative intracellular protease/amidase/anti-sigma factor RsiW